MARKKTKQPREARPRGVTKEHVAFGQRLRAARLKANVSQDELGTALGISFQQIQKYEKGVNRMDPMRMIQAADILDVSMDDLLGINGQKKNGHHAEFDAILATREGVQMIEAMIELTQAQRQLVIDIARKLPHLLAVA